MRIISGTKKGYMIKAPRKLPIRPTTDRSKERLFNILVNNFDLEDCSVLDLFSGSGNISLEFASRGAASITSVDKHPGCVTFLQQEAKKLEFDNISALRADVMQFLVNTEEKFDIIFCDAPYTTWVKYEEMVRLILDRALLKPEGWCIVEHHSVVKLDHVPEIFDRRAYGQNIMSFFKLPELIS
jgi:16S rRNA (guanine(966)-N(2))-methyltransferase RsmD